MQSNALYYDILTHVYKVFWSYLLLYYPQLFPHPVPSHSSIIRHLLSPLLGFCIFKKLHNLSEFGLFHRT